MSSFYSIVFWLSLVISVHFNCLTLVNSGCKCPMVGNACACKINIVVKTVYKKELKKKILKWNFTLNILFSIKIGKNVCVLLLSLGYS